MRRLNGFLQVILVAICTSCARDTAYVSKTQAFKKRMAPLIVVDAGHGGFNLGAREGGLEEKTLCLQTALLLREKLECRGYRVLMTRRLDEYIPLQKRAEIANQAKCQAFVSIHYNSSPNTKAHGIEIFYPEKTEPWRAKKSKDLAQVVLKEVLKKTEAKSRGVKTANFCVIREAHMPSILVEGGFLTNKEERKKIGNGIVYMNSLAEAIALGIDEYFMEML